MSKVLEISSTKNPLIKEIKGLYRKRNRWKTKSFIIEGIKILEEAIDNNIELKYIIFCDNLLSGREGRNLFERIHNKRNVVKVTEDVFKYIADTENPQGILGIAGFTIRDFKDIKNLDNPSLLFLDSIQDPGNIGTIIRTGDAFNIDGIILGEGCVDPYNSKVVRSTMGSIFRTPIYMCDNTLDCLNNIKDMGINILATSLDGELIYNKSLKDGFLCIIGNESKGVSQEVMARANDKVKIPMPGQAESLNAGIAASIIMYEAMKWRL